MNYILNSYEVLIKSGVAMAPTYPFQHLRQLSNFSLYVQVGKLLTQWKYNKEIGTFYILNTCTITTCKEF